MLAAPLLYRAPTSPEWAATHATTFRGLDELAFGGLWSARQYEQQLTDAKSTMLGVWSDDSLVAMACNERVLDEDSMLTLTVHPEWRGRGLARALMLCSLVAAKAAGQTLLTLEVRASNAAAVGLYLSCGLEEVGRRPKYYKDKEDALLLTRRFEWQPPVPAEAGDDGGRAQRAEAVDEGLEALVAASPAAAAIRSAARTREGSDGPYGELLGQL